MKNYYVYIATNWNNKVLYTGVTNNLIRRMYEHSNGLTEGFSQKYKIKKLVFYEIFGDIEDAIRAEKKIKSWVRIKKINLIKSKNPAFEDLLDFIKDPSLRHA